MFDILWCIDWLERIFDIPRFWVKFDWSRRWGRVSLWLLWHVKFIWYLPLCFALSSCSTDLVGFLRTSKNLKTRFFCRPEAAYFCEKSSLLWNSIYWLILGTGFIEWTEKIVSMCACEEEIHPVSFWLAAILQNVFLKIVKYSFPNCFEKCELLQTNASLSAKGGKHICLMFCRPICNCNHRKLLLSFFFHFTKANNCLRLCPHCVNYYHDQLARFLLMFQ